MALLTDVRARVDDMFVLKASCDTVLPPMYPDGAVQHDDAFVLTWVAVPVQPHEPDEVLSIFINNCIAFSWPIEDLVRRYRRFESVVPPALFVEVHDCLVTISKSLAAAWRSEEPRPTRHMRHEETTVLAKLVKAFGEATAAYGANAGVELDVTVLIPPRVPIRVETSNGSPLRIHLRGLRSVLVR